MLSALLFAGVVATQAPTMVVETSGGGAIACPVVESGGVASAACDDKSPRIEVTSGAPIPRKAPRTAGPVRRAEPGSRIRLETVAVYAREWDQPVRLSLDTTPDQAYSDMQTLRAVAARLEDRAPTWRYADR